MEVRMSQSLTFLLYYNQCYHGEDSEAGGRKEKVPDTMELGVALLF